VPCVDPLSLLPSVRWLAWQTGAVTETDDQVQVGMLGVLRIAFGAEA